MGLKIGRNKIIKRITWGQTNLIERSSGRILARKSEIPETEMSLQNDGNTKTVIKSEKI